MDKYQKTLVVNLLGDNKTDDAVNIILANSPKTLFKYRAGININSSTGKPYDIEALEKQKLWMSQAIQLDDPYDCSVLIKENVEALIKKMVELDNKFKNPKYIHDVRFINQNTREKALVCSLSENGMDIDMWTRYANCGKGFCIEYNYWELFKKQIIPFPVVYGNKTKSIKDFNNKQKVYIDILLKKTDKLNWSTQQEWRIIKNATEDEKKNLGTLIDTPKPVAIYLGYRIDKKLKEYIEFICKKNNIALYNVSLDSKEVALIKKKE